MGQISCCYDPSLNNDGVHNPPEVVQVIAAMQLSFFKFISILFIIYIFYKMMNKSIKLNIIRVNLVKKVFVIYVNL